MQDMPLQKINKILNIIETQRQTLNKFLTRKPIRTKPESPFQRNKEGCYECSLNLSQTNREKLKSSQTELGSVCNAYHTEHIELMKKFRSKCLI